MSNMTNSSVGKLSLFLSGLFWLSFSSLLFFQAVQPIMDPDFWWHLKNGQVMIQEGGLLQTDPFTFHDNSENITREANILKGYWLWEISAYGLYDLIGLNGVLTLKFLTIIAIASALALQIRRQKINLGIAAPLLFAGFFLLNYYPLERPQIFSFLFAIPLVGILSSAGKEGRLGLSLPIIMCLWSNVHGGVVVGNLILLCFAAGVVIEYRNDLSRMKYLLTWTIAGVVASLLNPNGWSLYKGLVEFQQSGMANLVAEYISTWVAFGNGSYHYAILWLFILLYFTAVGILRRVFWPELMIAIFLAYFSARYSRNTPFFTLALLPIIGKLWQEILKRWTQQGFKKLCLISATIAIFSIMWLVHFQWENWQPDVKMRAIYPEAAISFLHNNEMQGRMFNSYEYGGYLLWRLSPKSKVFIDGRGINPNVFDDYRKIIGANSNLSGQKDYESLLDSHQIDYVIQPIYDGYGNVQPLMKALLLKPEWEPVYLDTTVYILARPIRHNRDVIKTYQINKNEFKKRLLLIYNYLHRTNPNQMGYRIARADMLIYLGNYEEGSNEINEIIKRAPNDISLPLLRHRLLKLAGQKARMQN
jgi:hypothetical protein